jgi:pseudaminic acid cytidylyltransferase
VRVAVIPARGGSKRIPRKNIRSFAGRPLISFSIECALRSQIFDRVIVSTDDDEVAAVSEQYGAEVPFMRPASLADDYAGTTPVIAHAIEQLHLAGVPSTAVCCIYPTAPFINTDDLRTGLRKLLTGHWQYVFSATTFAFPVFRSFQCGEEGAISMFFPEHFAARSQDLPEALHDAGQFYWGQPEAWLSGKRIFDNWSTVVKLPRWRVQDIDTEEDWSRAEIMYSYLKADSTCGRATNPSES